MSATIITRAAVWLAARHTHSRGVKPVYFASDLIYWIPFKSSSMYLTIASLVNPFFLNALLRARLGHGYHSFYLESIGLLDFSPTF